MKRVIVLLLISMLSLACVAGCGGETKSQSEVSIKASVTDISSKTGKSSISESESGTKEDYTNTDTDSSSSDSEKWWDTPEFDLRTRVKTISKSGDSAYFVIGGHELIYDSLSLTACASHNDGTVWAISGFYGEDDSDFNETKFPGDFRSMQTAIKTYSSIRYAKSEFNIVSSEKLEIHGYEMIKYRGTVLINKGREHEQNTTFVGYATKLKSNGATACWVTIDDKENRYHTNETESLIDGQADGIAFLFHEEE